MARVSDSELRELVEAKDGERLTGFIDDAYLLVEENLATSSLTEARLTMIEKYLAAHFWVVAIEKGGLQREKMGEAENVYAKIGGLGLSSTRFGQQVATLDTTGILNKLLNPVKKAQLRVV